MFRFFKFVCVCFLSFCPSFLVQYCWLCHYSTRTSLSCKSFNLISYTSGSHMWTKVGTERKGRKKKENRRVDYGVNTGKWNGCRACGCYQSWFVYSIYLVQKVASLAILLVCFIVSYAHVAAGVPVVGGRNTWHVYDVNGTSKSSSIKSPESTNDSVVESWSLVCEDLCRWVECKQIYTYPT